MEFPASTASSSGKNIAGQRDQLMDQVKAQIAVANAQELLQVSDWSRSRSDCVNVSCSCLALAWAWLVLVVVVRCRPTYNKL